MTHVQRETIRVGTFNVLGLTGFRAADAAKTIGPHGSESWVDAWAEILARLNCDLLGLQEGVDHADAVRIARRAGWFLATIPSPLRWSGHVLSRSPILETRVFSHAAPVTTDHDPFSRCLGATLVDVDGGGRPWWFVDLHTCPSRPEIPEEEARRRRALEAEALEPVVDVLEASGHPLVVGGDFNSDVEEPIHERLRTRGYVNAMDAAGGGRRPTFGKHGTRPDHIYVLDHLYVGPPLAERLRVARVVDDAGFWYPGPEQAGRWVASDHLPVVAELAGRS
ncbi:MAG TPA: endonuclease/exonuclease/phosphatase family protein [Candidatus Limnocylindrales bacterium]|nr:endonuclease/exonuclease/phosphatase family protein [Candidatus Limnocylindrales bacterium]